MSEKIIIEMPFPPTDNHYRQPVKMGSFIRLILGPKAREYSKSTPLIIFDKDREALSGRIKLTLYHTMPCNRKRDLDNFLKGVQDAITKARVYEDDSQIDILTVVRCGVLPPGNVVAEIEEIKRVEQKVGKNGWKYYYPDQDFIQQEELNEVQQEFLK